MDLELPQRELPPYVRLVHRVDDAGDDAGAGVEGLDAEFHGDAFR